MKSLLDRMVEDGQVTQAEADAAWKTPSTRRVAHRLERGRHAAHRKPGTPGPPGREPPADRGRAALPELLLPAGGGKELLPLIGRKALYGGGKIYTGMSAQAQAAAEQASRGARLPDGATLGAALVRPDSGEVLALVGQKLTDARPSDWNNATQARRQVGSSVKPCCTPWRSRRAGSRATPSLTRPSRATTSP